MSAPAVAVDRDRLVDTASRMVGVHSFTGDEQAMAELMRELYEELGLRCQWQQVEDGRANALGVLDGAGGGPSLMFNGHMDTSYSGREPWLRDVPGFQPEAFVRDGRLYGLGISNMKGALACYVEAVRALGTRACACGATCWSQRSAARSRRPSRATRSGPSTAATRRARAISSPTAGLRTCASWASRPRGRSSSVTSVPSG